MAARVACLLLTALLGWGERGGADEGLEGPWLRSTRELETPCPLPAPFPLILPPFLRAMGLRNCDGVAVGDQCPSVHYRLTCSIGAERISVSLAGSDARHFMSLSL